MSPDEFRKIGHRVVDWIADYPEAENFLFPLFHSSNHGGGGNRAWFADPDGNVLSLSQT